MAEEGKETIRSQAEGQIDEKTLAKARQMIGVRLRPEGPFLQDATPDTMRNFCNGIGDANPLYRDLEYGRNTQFATMLAHPVFPICFGWVGRTRWGFPGAHGFFGGNEWECFRNVRPGDRITLIERVVGVEEKTSSFSGRLAIQFMEGEYYNQHDEIIARVLGWCTRHERKAAVEKRKYSDVQAYEYSDEELARISDAVLNEPASIRGQEVRYWEDVTEGEELSAIARGPLSTMDTIAFAAGCGRAQSSAQMLHAAARHPGHFVKAEGPGPRMEHTINIHHKASLARKAGIPGVLDYGAQRMSWLCTLVTNWMGDAGIFKRFRTELRLPNPIGDTTWCKGRVQKKYVVEGFPCVDVEIWAENQRGQVTAPNGIATVILPSRDISTKNAQDGSRIDLGYGVYSGIRK